MFEATAGRHLGPRRHAYPRGLRMGTSRPPSKRHRQIFAALPGCVTALRGRAQPLRRKEKQWPRSGRAFPATAGPRNASIEMHCSRPKIRQVPAATKSSPPRGRPFFFGPRKKLPQRRTFAARWETETAFVRRAQKAEQHTAPFFEPPENPVPWNSPLQLAMSPSSPLLQGWPVSADTQIGTRNRNSACRVPLGTCPDA